MQIVSSGVTSGSGAFRLALWALGTFPLMASSMAVAEAMSLRSVSNAFTNSSSEAMATDTKRSRLPDNSDPLSLIV